MIVRRNGLLTSPPFEYVQGTAKPATLRPVVVPKLLDEQRHGGTTLETRASDVATGNDRKVRHTECVHKDTCDRRKRDTVRQCKRNWDEGRRVFLVCRLVERSVHDDPSDVVSQPGVVERKRRAHREELCEERIRICNRQSISPYV